jgi:hypothetical protein
MLLNACIRDFPTITGKPRYFSKARVARSFDDAVKCCLIGALVFLLENREVFSLFNFFLDAFL